MHWAHIYWHLAINNFQRNQCKISNSSLFYAKGSPIEDIQFRNKYSKNSLPVEVNYDFTLFFSIHIKEINNIIKIKSLSCENIENNLNFDMKIVLGMKKKKIIKFTLHFSLLHKYENWFFETVYIRPLHIARSDWLRNFLCSRNLFSLTEKASSLDQHLQWTVDTIKFAMHC